MGAHGARFPLALVVAAALGAATEIGAQYGCKRKLTASDAAAGDAFGVAVAVHGDVALVGALYDDDAGSFSGGAYVFVREGTSWMQQQKLTAGDAAAGDFFGVSVAVQGDTALVGAYGDDDGGAGSGSAYVFVRSGTVWTQQAKLTASDPGPDDQFGNSVALSGDTALVGAWHHDGAAADSGAAYVFVRNGTVWSQQAKLTASDAAASDFLGISVSLDGNTAAAGAHLNDDAGSASGSAYVFVRSGTVWTQQQKLTAADAAAGDFFGASVSLSSDTAVVGAFHDDDAGTSSGSAYVFVRSGTVWSQQQKLTAADAAQLHIFGFSVAVSGDKAVIGAYWDDDGGTDSGAAYVFARSGAVWTQQAKLTASDAAAGDNLGYSVALAADTAIAGAWQDDDASAGADAGSAWVFVPSAAGSITPFGAGCLGSNGFAPGHASTDTPDIGTIVTYQAANLPPNATAVLWIGDSNTYWGMIPLPLSLGIIGAQPSCNLLISYIASAPMAVDGAGNGISNVLFPELLGIGANIYSQVLAIDLLVPSPLKLIVSNGLHTIAGCQ